MKNHCKRVIVMITVLLFSLSCTVSAMTGNVKITTVETEQVIGTVSRPFFNKWSDITPALQTVVSNDGTVSVLSVRGESDINIYEFDSYGQYIRTLSFPKVLSLVGAFERDNDGNYYIFYAKSVDEGSFDEKNMALVKYSPQAEPLNSFYLQAQTEDERWASGYSGVKVPFHAGTCKIEISDNLIAVYFARTMFVSNDGLNHQASYGFVLDLNTFEKLTDKNNRMPSAGHSFNQFVLPIDGGFITVDHGDNGPRAFMFSRITPNKSDSVSAFTFKRNEVYQNTFAEMGGIVKTSDGYLFVGTYEKNDDTSTGHNDSRNLFVLTMNENLGNISDPIWLTDYTDMDTENAIFPKIIGIDEERILLMWSVYGLNKREATVCYTVVDQNGAFLQPISYIPQARLNGFDPLRYNPVSGLVHWAIEDGNNRILLYSFDPTADAISLESINTASNWAQESIVNAIYAQLVPSDLQRSYGVNITRAEFCHMAVTYIEAQTGMDIDIYLQQMGLTINRDSFSDTEDGDILAANTLGIVNGIGNRLFNPDGDITRQEAATMLMRLQRVLGHTVTETETPNFIDASSISLWAVEGITYCYDNDVMTGVGGNRFDPHGTYTREQAITTMYRLFTL